MIWRVRLICCGRDDGDVFRDTWEEADAFRNAYTSGPGVRHFNGRYWEPGHDRAGIIELLGERPLPPEVDGQAALFELT